MPLCQSGAPAALDAGPPLGCYAEGMASRTLSIEGWLYLFTLALVAVVLGVMGHLSRCRGPLSAAPRFEDDRLVDLLAHGDIETSHGAARQLIESGRSNVIFRAVRDDRDSARATAAKFLRHAADRRLARLVLLRLLRDEDDHVRLSSVWALGGVGEPRDIPLLEALARDDAFFNVRAAVPETITEIRER